MTPSSLLQAFISGTILGANYVLLALGLTVIFSIMSVLNFAHGEIYMIGAVIVYYVSIHFHINYVLALFIAIVATGLLGFILERFLFRPAKGDILTGVIVATGLIWFFQTGALLIFGPQPKYIQPVVSGTWHVLGAVIPKDRVLAGAISVVLLIAVYYFIYRTKQGKAMQAVAQDREAAALQGVDINLIGPLGFIIGCALAGAAGRIMLPVLYADPYMGSSVLSNSLSIIILGGIGSIPGAALGGLILGLVNSFGQQYAGYVSSIFPFVIILAVLLFKRTGLMGRKM
jgi:branched-chain amino acid transport system permease protein